MLFTWEQNNSCLTRFFILKITSKIFTPANFGLSFAEVSTNIISKLYFLDSWWEEGRGGYAFIRHRVA